MDEHTLTSLIDQYLLGTISPSDKKHLEELMAADPQVAELVKDSKQAYKALILARNRQLRDKLRELDKDDMLQSGFRPRWLNWFSFVGLMMMIYVYLACVYFNPATVAGRNFYTHKTAESHLEESPEVWVKWTNANDAFLAKKYKEAIVLYESLIATDPTNIALARWNILLAQLALEGPSSNWKAGIREFAKKAPEPLASKADRLAALFDSWIYHLFAVPFRENFSAIKPKLI